MKELTVRFTESASEEITALIKELQLIPLAEAIQQYDDIPEELREPLKNMISIIIDLFSPSVPDVDANPDRALRIVSRDINLSRILRERGYFRLYRLIKTVDENGLPLYMSLVNPDSGKFFSKQEEFIGWFCENAKVARAPVFMRLSTIGKLLSLGLSLEEAFTIVIAKPYVVQETLENIATWKNGQLVEVDPEKLIRLTAKVAPAYNEQVQDAVDYTGEDRQEKLQEIAKPVFTELLTQVADHQRSKDALDWVKHDLLYQPRVSYKWDEETHALIIELTKVATDAKGVEYESDTVIIPYVPDSLDVPEEIIKDLQKRLPIRNRNMLGLD